MKALIRSFLTSLLLCAFFQGIAQNSPVSYIQLYDGDALAGRQINTSLPVGSIAGGASVSGSGGATYQVPIYVPPGTRGMAPSLSLVYSSQSPNGNLGVGWSLTGLSAVHRIGKDWFHDGEAGPVTLDGDPVGGIPTGHFALDGNRLEVESGVYGANSSMYHTEAETFSRITSMSIAGSGPDWFQVEAKNGMIYEYGTFKQGTWSREWIMKKESAKYSLSIT